MGKEKGAAGAVGSDYSGRPLGRRSTREEVAAGDPGPGTFLGTDLPDGRHALVGPGGKLFYEHFEDGQPVWDRPVDPKEVHPRVGGENLLSPSHTSSNFGSIPAWAGKPRVQPHGRDEARVHPRVGGETSSPAPWARRGPSPSPRGRGNLESSPMGATRPESIPAWAGKPRVQPHGRDEARVHPRVGGETFSSLLKWYTPRVHPRVGGETERAAQAQRSDVGPSPRGRGNPLSAYDSSCRLRSIPAWAGKPMASRTSSRIHAVHPRVGGETAGPRYRLPPVMGPSPRGRGNHPTVDAGGRPLRSIPAWAGKPSAP